MKTQFPIPRGLRLGGDHRAGAALSDDGAADGQQSASSPASPILQAEPPISADRTPAIEEVLNIACAEFLPTIFVILARFPAVTEALLKKNKIFGYIWCDLLIFTCICLY
jgi:hypothetical protein